MRKQNLAGDFRMILCATLLLSMPALAQTDSVKETKDKRSVVARLPWARPADDPATDPVTGLPTKIIDKKSGIVMVLIPAGKFVMGSPDSEKERSKGETQHIRVIRKPFYLGETEVTLGQFRKFIEASKYVTDAERGTPEGGHTKGAFASVPAGEREWHHAASWQNPFPTLPEMKVTDEHPVVQVSWNDATAFCKHFGLRLPTEAEWEYACRAGSQTRFPWGESEEPGQQFGNVGDQSLQKRFASVNVIFPFDDGNALLAKVGQYKPNSWQVKDMIGNVEELVADHYGKYPADGSDETAAVNERAGRVLRGGSWLGNPITTRSASRIGMTAASRRDFQGFRAARSIDP